MLTKRIKRNPVQTTHFYQLELSRYDTGTYIVVQFTHCPYNNPSHSSIRGENSGAPPSVRVRSGEKKGGGRKVGSRLLVKSVLHTHRACVCVCVKHVEKAQRRFDNRVGGHI